MQDSIGNIFIEDVINALAAKYIQIPLIFPIQTVQIKDFTDEIPLTINH